MNDTSTPPPHSEAIEWRLLEIIETHDPGDPGGAVRALMQRLARRYNASELELQAAALAVLDAAHRHRSGGIALHAQPTGESVNAGADAFARWWAAYEDHDLVTKVRDCLRLLTGRRRTPSLRWHSPMDGDTLVWAFGGPAIVSPKGQADLHRLAELAERRWDTTNFVRPTEWDALRTLFPTAIPKALSWLKQASLATGDPK